METIRICKNQNVLSEFLSERGKEVEFIECSWIIILCSDFQDMLPIISGQFIISQTGFAESYLTILFFRIILYLP